MKQLNPGWPLEQIQSEIAALKSEIQVLQQERADLTINHDVMASEHESPLAMVQAYRLQARENPQLSAELKGIDDAIAALKSQVHHKQTELAQLPRKTQLIRQQQQLEEAKELAQIHAERINELAGELIKEIRSLKACADHLSPLYWQVYYKPFITGFKTISVPYVRSDGEVWMIVNRII